jgi:hypothetical protein
LSSSGNQPPAASHNGTAAGLLNALANVNGEVALALQVGSLVLPLVKGVIKEVRSLTGTETIEYTIAVSTGEANLDHAIKVDDDVVADVNSELVRQGVAPLPATS